MLNRPLPALPGDIVLLMGRVVLGGVLFAHGWHKVMVDGIAGTSGEFERLGVPLAILSASFAAFVEFVGGVLLIVGALTTTVVALDLVVMVGAAVFVHLTHGIGPENGGLELVVVIVAAELVLIARGPGRLSVDEWILELRRRNEPRRRGEQGRSAAVAVPAAVTPPPLAVASVGRPVGGTGQMRAQGWVSGSWADGFDGEPSTAPDGRAVLPSAVAPVGQSQPIMRPEPGAPWGVWHPAGDVPAGVDRRSDPADGATQRTDTAPGAGQRREPLHGADDLMPRRVGNVTVDDGGQVGASGAGPTIPSTRDGDARSPVVEGASIGAAVGDTRIRPTGAASPGPVSPGPVSRGAGNGTSFWTPDAGPERVAPGRPAGAAPEVETSGPAAESTRTDRGSRVDGVVPSPIARVGAAVPVPVPPVAPDRAAPSPTPTPAGAGARPAATTGLHRRPAEPARRKPAAGPVAAEIFRPVTEGVLPPAASYPHPGDSPDPISRSVRAYAPQPSAPAPLSVSARTIAPGTTGVVPDASELPATSRVERTGTASGRRTDERMKTVAVPAGPVGGQAGAIAPVGAGAPDKTTRGPSGAAAVVRRTPVARSASPAAGEPTPSGVAVQAPVDFTPTTAIPVTRPTLMLQSLHQSAEYQPTPTDALPRTSPPEKTVARRPSPRPSAAGSSR